MSKLDVFRKFKIYIGKDGAIIACHNRTTTSVNLCYREIVRECTFDADVVMCDVWTGFELGGERFDLNVYPQGPGEFGAVIYPVNEYDETDTDKYEMASLVCVDRDASIIRGGIPKKYRVRTAKILTVE